VVHIAEWRIKSAGHVQPKEVRPDVVLGVGLLPALVAGKQDKAVTRFSVYFKCSHRSLLGRCAFLGARLLDRSLKGSYSALQSN